VFDPADQQAARPRLLLEVALQTKRLVALGKQLVIDGAMHAVAGGAPFPDGFMLENEWAVLGGVTPAARLVHTGKRGSHVPDCRTAMRIVAVAAGQLGFRHRMMMRQVKLTAHIQVALKTNLWRPIRINNVIASTAGFYVETSRPVTRFAT
jgi:hypothetical protein